MAYTFDGPNKIISFDASTTAVDVQDLYSRWVDWFLTSDNSKFLLAMRNVGGDPLPGSKQLGLTYFFMNGWKLRPYEETHVLAIDGNLYSEDGSSPFTPVLGAYNVTIINTVSNLVDSTVQQLPEIEYSSFQNRVTVDVDNGSVGTTYPVGTPASPVNNLADALAIAAARGFKVLDLLSDLTITTGANIDGYTIRSDYWPEVTVETGVSQVNTIYERLSLYGEMGAYWNVLIDCWVYDITEFSGWMRGGSFESIALSEYAAFGGDFGGLSYFDDVVPMYPGVTAILTSNTDVQVSFTNCKEIVTLMSTTAGSVYVFGLGEGKLIVDVSCTGGEIKATGYGEVANNSALTVDQTELTSENVASAVWDEPLDDHLDAGTTGAALSTAGSGGMDPALVTKIDEIHRFKGLDAANPKTHIPGKISAGDVEIILTGDGITTQTLTRTP